MQYFDDKDTAHAELKASLQGKLGEPPLTFFFEDALNDSGDFPQLQG